MSKYLLDLKFIPDDIKQGLKMLGKGVTSIAFDKNSEEVVLVTLESYKMDWIEKNKLGHLLKKIEIFLPSLRKKTDVFVFKVKKLFKLSEKNKEKILSLLELLDTIFGKEYEISKKMGETFLDFDEMDFKLMLRALKNTKHRDEIKKITGEKNLHELVSFLEKLNPLNFEIDIHNLDNWMEDSEGNIVLIDPVVSKEYIEFVREKID